MLNIAARRAAAIAHTWDEPVRHPLRAVGEKLVAVADRPK
jgi:hypothetical protein